MDFVGFWGCANKVLIDLFSCKIPKYTWERVGTGCLVCNVSGSSFPYINEYLLMSVVVRQNCFHLYVGMNTVEQNRYALKVESQNTNFWSIL